MYYNDPEYQRKLEYALERYKKYQQNYEKWVQHFKQKRKREQS